MAVTSSKKSSKQAIISTEQTRRQRLIAFGRSHLQAFKLALARLWQRRLMTLVTVSIMGLGLSIPLLLALAFDNLVRVQPATGHRHAISLLLHHQTVNRVDGLIKRLRGRSDVAEVNYISPEEGLALFQANMSGRDVLANLPHNPIPPLIEIMPSQQHAAPQAIEALARTLEHWPEVASVKVNMQWVQRLHQWVQLFRLSSYGLMVLLIMGVLLVSVFNIYHAIRERREEIYIVYLVGGTYAFIRRPFLYTGMLYGIISACFAWLIVTLIQWSLYPVIQELHTLYAFSVPVVGLDFITGMLVVVFSCSMGLSGAWFASELEIMAATQST